MKAGELALLLSKESAYLVEVGKRKIQTRDGIFDLEILLRKKFGEKISSHLGKEFSIAKPNLIDILEKRIRRFPQVIMPKDIALILSYTGIQQGSLVVDAGTGSGYTAIFLASYIKPGKVVTYEKDERFVKVAKENIKLSGLAPFIKLKHKDISQGIDEKKVDLVVLDMKGAEKVVEHAWKALNCGGWLVVYSPYIEQVIGVRAEIEKRNFCQVKTVENIVREWQAERYTRPKTIGIMHTGFLTFARKSA